MASKPSEIHVSAQTMLMLTQLDDLRKQRGLTKLKLLRTGMSVETLRMLEKRGILSSSVGQSGVVEYVVADDFIAKLTG